MLDKRLEQLYEKVGQFYLDFLYASYNQSGNEYNKEKNRKIKMKYADDMSIDAWSAYNKKENGDMITIARGLPEAFYRYAKYLVGDTEHSTQTQEFLAFHIFMTSLRFVIGHEFHHLYAGHCEYLYQKESDCKRLGVAYDAATRLPMTDFQTLEMNADCGATCRLVDITVSPKYSEPFMPEQVAKVLDAEPNGRIKYLIHAIDIIFFAFRYLEHMIVNPYYDEESHPPTLLRQMMNLSTIQKYLKVIYCQDISWDFINNCMTDDEIKLVRLDNLVPNLLYYKYSLNADIIKHESILRNNWLIMKDVLAPFSRIAPAEFVEPDQELKQEKN